jgi:maleate isomerase
VSTTLSKRNEWVAEGGAYRVGLVVPSSNTTMETEVPAMLQRRGEVEPETFTVHSSRVRMRNVTAEELTQMVSASDRCVVELADAQVDVVAYACLVAVMVEGFPAHERIERHLAAVAAENGCPVPVVSSAGALVRALHALGASRIAIVAPYLEPLTALVCDYFASADIEVVDSVSLEIPRNVDVARHDPLRLPEIAKGLDRRRADAVILSACVQMPSLPAVQQAQTDLGVPVLSASIATAYEILARLGLRRVVPEAGALLSRDGAPASAEPSSADGGSSF